MFKIADVNVNHKRRNYLNYKTILSIKNIICIYKIK